MYTNNNYYYVALISKAQGQCGFNASLQPPMNLATQIKLFRYSNPMTGESQKAKLQNRVECKVQR